MNIETNTPTPDIISQQFDGTKRYIVKRRMRYRRVLGSLSFNHDKNPIHVDPLEAKILLLSIACGKSAGRKNSDSDYCPRRAFDSVAERIRRLDDFVIAPGIWLSGLFDAYFTFPESSYPKKIPKLGKNHCFEPECIIGYASSKYINPLIVPTTKYATVDLIFDIKQKEKPGAAEINAKEVTFTIVADDLFNYKSLLKEGSDIDKETGKIIIQRTTLDLFPKNTPLEKIENFYSNNQNDLAKMSPEYRLIDSGSEIKTHIDLESKVDNRQCILTASKTTYVSGEDYAHYGISIGRENLGDVCKIVAPLALQTKIPRVLFVAVDEIEKEKNQLYHEIISSNLKYKDFIECKKIDANSEKRIEKQKQAQAQLVKDEAERQNAIDAYLAIHPATDDIDTTAETTMNRKLRVYIEQQTQFNPVARLGLGEEFNLNASLTDYVPGFGGLHYFFVQAKTGADEEGIVSGKELMRANTKISVTPLITKDLAQYLRQFRLTLDLEPF
jgi:hypothetical protein